MEDLGDLIEREDENPQATPPEPGAIILLPSDVRVISKMLGLNIMSPEQLMQRVAKLTTIAVNGQVITLSPALLDRLKSRAVRKPLAEYVESEIIRLLSGAVGI